MKKIITIDFDIIMAPSINLYNGLVPMQPWDQIMNDPHFQLLTPDYTHYQKIFTFIMRCVEEMDADHIHFIEDHGQAVKYITEKCDLVNIDHHHDITYAPPEVIKDEIKPTCANWVSYLQEEDLLNSYEWINNANSTLIDEQVSPVAYRAYDLREYNLEALDTPDELIICLSEPWVPPYIRPLFYTLMDYCNSHYHTHFDLLMGAYRPELGVVPLKS